MAEVCLSGGVLEQQLNFLPQGDYCWRKLIAEEFASDRERYTTLDKDLTERYRTEQVNPACENIFRAFAACPLDQTRVVICGQDPYPNPAHAMGLAFSIPADTKQPPSLKNILKELESDIGPGSPVENGDLSYWARQGVLMLNTALTVREGAPNSHKALWGDFSLKVLCRLNREQNGPLAFILWGNQAREIGTVMERTAPPHAPRLFHYGVHPSPLSAYRGFFGSRPFSQVNQFLEKHGEIPVKW